MVSIVLVSHSDKVAAGMKEFLEQLGNADIIVPKSEGLGTSAVAIAEAIEKCNSEALLICDIGSSVINAKSAIDLSGKSAEIADCPFVEGAVVACVSASMGMSMDEVRAEAEKTWEMRKLTSI
jgi:dihydroxyacetone kinase DhaKLM complex PTS-EIIA-like component DhaM